MGLKENKGAWKAEVYDNDTQMVHSILDELLEVSFQHCHQSLLSFVTDDVMACCTPIREVPEAFPKGSLAVEFQARVNLSISGKSYFGSWEHHVVRKRFIWRSTNYSIGAMS